MCVFTGSADAQFSLGQYYYSRGDYEMAVQHFQHAEASGSSQASYQLAVMFYDGLGTQQDPVRDVRMFCPLHSRLLSLKCSMLIKHAHMGMCSLSCFFPNGLWLDID